MKNGTYKYTIDRLKKQLNLTSLLMNNDTTGVYKELA
jgi:hypothetical protein